MQQQSMQERPQRVQRRGVLLINLGTPEAPEARAVRPYLREFLSDPRVIDLPAPARWMLVNLIIAPFRAPKSAHAYRAIWTPQGSPLLIHSETLRAAVASALGPNYVVALGMRYGKPSIATAVRALEQADIDQLIVLPLFPQHASATVASAVEKLYEVVVQAWDTLPVTIVPPFFADPGFVTAQAEVARQSLTSFRPEVVLMSFHGLPERHVIRSDRTAQMCDRRGPCPELGPHNRMCYRAQCYATARLLASALELRPEQFVVSFQSRLGRTPWLQPYTDLLLGELAGRGVKRLAVMCPSFASDCLETLEEIGIRGKERWLAAGGEDFALIPCVNSDWRWVSAVCKLVTGAGAER